MQGTIAQLLSLAAYGNEYFSGRLDNDYFPNHFTFKFCKFVHFFDLKNSDSKWRESEFAANPNDWFKKLKETGVVQLRVRYISTNKEQISDRMSVAFIGGGGRWLIETVKSSGSDFWEANWRVGDRNDPDQNIWHVKYGRILKNSTNPEQQLPSASEIKEKLSEALQRISDFAHKNDHSNFGECFDKGLEALNESFNTDNKYKIFPDGYAPLEHQQLLNACQSAWVFGGMGSWNDIGFNDDITHKEYEDLSNNLFNLINLSLLVASNPFSRTASERNEIHSRRNGKWWELWKRR